MHGMTLIEVVVVLAIIGIIAGVTALAIPRVMKPTPDDPVRMLGAARRRALRDGEAVSTRLLIHGVMHGVVALPDGSVIVDSGVGVDRFTARWRHAP